ncbi:hypothetical protein BG011_004554 [Mortierella polycephala]|uniref:C2H2-type domain-containing protein n=1 Tax=Mortierella polycephala TaxID=41804 RepID=A0A9P6QES0_9FUNG|nr:hypothetical protein BG011_004554 [Mortierella polycephala]
MALVDRRDQTMASVPPYATTPMTALSAAPMFYRSLSAPSHMQFSELSQNTFAPNELGGNGTQELFYQSPKLVNEMNAPFQTSSPQQHVFDQQYPMAHPLSMTPVQTDIQSSFMMNNRHSYICQPSVHPLQMDAVGTPLSTANPSIQSGVKMELPNSTLPWQTGTSNSFSSEMDDAQASNASIAYSPSSSSLGSYSPTFGAPFGSLSVTRSTGRVHSMPFHDTDLSQFELPEDLMGYAFPRHGSVGSLYPITQSHELLDSTYTTAMHSSLDLSTDMVPSLSSTSISSASSQSPSHSSTANSSAVPKQRRASLSPDGTGRLFTCIFGRCGKLFKRSEHLKRHVRSVHTLEKPFRCPVQHCTKKFSRTDNLNQHIRVHRHDKEKASSKPFTNFSSCFPDQF